MLRSGKCFVLSMHAQSVVVRRHRYYAITRQACGVITDNIHGTGLETCHVSASNARAGVRTLPSLHIIYGILYLKDRSGSCGTILEKPWGL